MNLPPITGANLVGLACHLGTARAIEFVAFAESNQELEQAQQKLLLRGWLAIEHMPGDASLEASDLQRCLTALRQAWMKIKYGEA